MSSEAISLWLEVFYTKCTFQPEHMGSDPGMPADRLRVSSAPQVPQIINSVKLIKPMTL